MKKSIVSLKNSIIETGKRAYTRGYAASNDGNISVRIDNRSVLITPAGISKGFMKPNDLAVVGMDGRVKSGKNKPTSEILMHLKIYEERPDVNSVCHLHPPYATGFAVAGIPFETDFLSEAILFLGKVPMVEYGTPGTEELSAKLLPHLKGSDVFILANHGALTIGSSVMDAYNKMETLEHSAHILLIARQLGYVNRLKEEDVKKLWELREKFRN